MAGADGGERARAWHRRIRYAADLEALWFMRGELMGLLARSHGEAAAREMLEEPERACSPTCCRSGLRSRPSPLSDSLPRHADGR